MAEFDGIVGTIADTGWTPLLTTPPYPDYPSGLCGTSGGGIGVLVDFFGEDSVFFLDSNGLPYLIDSLVITATSPGTAAFDVAEEKGTPLAIRPIVPPKTVAKALPLDQLIVTFGE